MKSFHSIWRLAPSCPADVSQRLRCASATCFTGPPASSDAPSVLPLTTANFMKLKARSICECLQRLALPSLHSISSSVRLSCYAAQCWHVSPPPLAVSDKHLHPFCTSDFSGIQSTSAGFTKSAHKRLQFTCTHSTWTPSPSPPS